MQAPNRSHRRAEITVSGHDERGVECLMGSTLDEGNRDRDIRLLLLVRVPALTALAAGRRLLLEPASLDRHSRTMDVEGVPERLLPAQAVGLTAHGRREVLHLGEALPGQKERSAERLEVEPEIPTPILLLEPVVEVEAVDVSNDVGHPARLVIDPGVAATAQPIAAASRTG
jgi:hypothetical protein